MRSNLLTAAHLKLAFEIRPFNTSEMATYGGLAGGALGGIGGALTGLIGTGAQTPERRKAMIRRALIGLIAGGGIGAATGGYAAYNTRNKLLEAMTPDDLGSPSTAAFSSSIEKKLKNQEDQGPYKKLKGDPDKLDVPSTQAVRELIDTSLQQTKVQPESAMRMLFRQPNAQTQVDLDRGMSEAPAASDKAWDDKGWDVIKKLQLMPKSENPDSLLDKGIDMAKQWSPVEAIKAVRSSGQ